MLKQAGKAVQHLLLCLIRLRLFFLLAKCTLHGPELLLKPTKFVRGYLQNH